MRARILASAVVLALPLSVVTSTGMASPVSPRPVAPEVRTVALEPVAVTLGATVAQARAQTPEVGLDEDVVVVGATWVSGAPRQDLVVEVRQRAAGRWSPWEALDVEAPTGPSENEERSGTEAYVVVGADRVQVRVSATSGPVPAGVRLEVVDPGRSAADAAAGRVPAGSASAAATRPTVLSRADWGADESLRVGRPSYASTLKAAVIHHTAGSNSYTAEQTASVIRGIYAFHVQSRGWSDIGYNMLADRFGRLWEGRYGGIDKPVIGAHVANYNTGSFGISVMGTFESAAPSATTTDAVTRAIAWKLGLHGVSATGTTTLNDRSIPTIVGHRDLGQTACPGTAFYAKIPGIRTAAKSYQGDPAAPEPAPEPTPEPAPPAPAVPLARDLTGDGLPDMLARSNTQVSLLARTAYPVLGARQVGVGWQGMNVVVGSPDLTGDGHSDLVAREAATGRLWVYRGNGKGGFGGVSPLGTGWGGMAHIVTPGDWTGDGRADLLAVHGATGQMYLYPGNGAGGLGRGSVIGHGWQGMRLLATGRDMDVDGKADLLAVDGTGVLRLYAGNGRGGFSGARVVSDGWGAADVLLGTGDWDRDGAPDLTVRLASGQLLSAYGAGDGTLEASMRWGAGWDVMRSVVAPGDWDGDGLADLLAVHGTTGALLLYRGLGGREYAAPRALGIPASDVRDLVVVGDVDGAGGPDVVTRDRVGSVFLSRIRADGSAAPREQIGWNWSGMDLFTAAGDLSGDGIPDLVAREAGTGKLFVYPFTAAGRFAPPQQVGTGWGVFDVVVGVGTWDDGPTADLLARRASDGALFLYPGAGPARLGSGRQVGHGWSGMQTLLGTGDHDGDGHADLFARTAAGTDLVYRGNGLGGFAGSVTVLGLPRGSAVS